MGNFKKKGNVYIVSVKQLLSPVDNTPLLTEAEILIKEGINKFIIDLSELMLMNSVGIGFLLALLKKSREAGGDMVLINISKYIKTLLEITKLTPIIRAFDSEEQAIQALEKGLN